MCISKLIRGQVIATAKRTIKRISRSHYFVKSQLGNGKCEVSATKLGRKCSSPSFTILVSDGDLIEPKNMYDFLYCILCPLLSS
jgi:hypothetical protein